MHAWRVCLRLAGKLPAIPAVAAEPSAGCSEAASEAAGNRVRRLREDSITES